MTDADFFRRLQGEQLTTAEVLAMYHGGVPIDLRTLPSATALAAYWRTTTG